jgi:hypothetical protein
MPREFSIPPDARARMNMLFGEMPSDSREERVAINSSTSTATDCVEPRKHEGEDSSQCEESEITQS